MSEDEVTGEVAIKRVTQVFENESDELVHVYVNGEEIVTTPEHPFHVPKLGWTSAGSLRAGDVLVMSNGELVVVEFVQHKTQHGYEIYDGSNNEPIKTGISGSKLNKNGTSRRANSQVNKLNREAGYERYSAKVVKTDMPNRQTALKWETDNATRLHNEGFELPNHFRPRSWEK